MTPKQGKRDCREIQMLVQEDRELLRELVRGAVQEVLETEMDEALGAHKGERTAARLGYRSGHYGRSLTTRVGTLELRVPQDRHGLFSTELFERYQRSEKALVAALSEMYVLGVSTRKVAKVTEALCGREFSASAVSRIAQGLDAELQALMGRPLEAEFPYLYLDARYEKVREGGVVQSRAVLVALGVDREGRRQVLAVELANRESASSWKDFLLGLKARGLRGVLLAISDSPPGLETRGYGGAARGAVAALLRALFAQRPGFLAPVGRGR